MSIWIAVIVGAIWLGIVGFTLADMLRIPRSAWVRMPERRRPAWIAGIVIGSLICIPFGCVIVTAAWFRSDDRDALRQWASQ